MSGGQQEPSPPRPFFARVPFSLPLNQDPATCRESQSCCRLKHVANIIVPLYKPKTQLSTVVHNVTNRAAEEVAGVSSNLLDNPESTSEPRSRELHTTALQTVSWAASALTPSETRTGKKPAPPPTHVGPLQTSKGSGRGHFVIGQRRSQSLLILSPPSSCPWR